MDAKLRILDELVDECAVKPEEAECWRQRYELLRDDPQGRARVDTFRTVAKALGRRKSTIRRWWCDVDDKINQRAKDEGPALRGVTIYRSGAGATETPFVVDPVVDEVIFG